ncbi:IS1-like element transposase [Izhakiella capsodis]|uniref:IS1-like element transposase n=1 Tax=Izhakiella capsodis TaxID=1367852 RepID=UPI000B8A3302
MICRHFSHTHGIIRNGHSCTGAQLYRCDQYLKTFQINYRYNGVKPDTHHAIEEMAMNDAGHRDTARALRITLNTVLRHH